jgi:phospholipid N-methyltransferase
MLNFLRQVFRDYHHVGAIAPSSRALARALAKPLQSRPHGTQMNILEVGPGTGALTRGIFENMKPGDRLTLCEINEDFVRILQNRFETDPEFAVWKNHSRIVCAPIEDLPAEERYHHIVSGLPFNNFPAATVCSILDKYRQILVEGGTVNFFEYVAIRHMKRPICSKAEKQRIDEVEKVLSEYIGRYQVSVQLVLLNIPPAWARTLIFR